MWQNLTLTSDNVFETIHVRGFLTLKLAKSNRGEEKL